MIRKETVPKFLYAVCVLLFLGFLIRLGADYSYYIGSYSSAPFWVFVLVRALEFLLPCGLCFLAAALWKRKHVGVDARHARAHADLRRCEDASGKVVVLVHGFMGAPSQLADLTSVAHAAGWDCCCVTLPGHDAPLCQFVRTGGRDWQSALDALIDGLRTEYERIVIVGHSMGGLLAVETYARDPDRICGIVALALPLYGKLDPEGIRIRLASLRPPREGEDVRISAARMGCGVKGVTVWNAVRLLPNTVRLTGMMRRTRKTLKTVSPPVTMVNSRADEIVSLKTARYFRERLPGCKSVMLQRASHFWYDREERTVIENTLLQVLSGL